MFQLVKYASRFIFLGYNKFTGFDTSSTIPRERVMWKFSKNSEMYGIPTL